MCGFTGLVSCENLSQYDLTDIIIKMGQTIQHRGPDDNGIWVDSENGIALSHQRLSVIDLSSSGHQPMFSSCGRYCLVYNGEIYNHISIRNSLEKEGINIKWRGHSDTETLLEAVSVWGLEKTLVESVGMFALSILDRKENAFYLARDRMGEKPLYYGFNNKNFLFGSELKAISAFPDFKKDINKQALALYLQYNYIPTPYSIFQGIKKLKPGAILRISIDDIRKKYLPSPKTYWSVRDAVINGKANQFEGTEDDASIKFDKLLRQSISGQMLADVPLGAFLSGGIDSTMVTAIMQSESMVPVKTFTIGFQESEYNEANYANAIASFLKTNHTELYVTPNEVMDVIPALPKIYDEPFSDPSQIPTYLLSKLTREQVTVSLSGDGGDELFGGYNRYISAPLIWRRFQWMPRNIRLVIAGIMTYFPPALWDKIFQFFNIFLSPNRRIITASDKIYKIASLLSNGSPEEIYISIVTYWKKYNDAITNLPENNIVNHFNCLPDASDLENCMMYLDSITYLPDDILVKTDRAAMSVSLETRVPFLDHRLVEFAWQVPLSMKIRNNRGKWLVRKALDHYVPRNLIDRPKTGFAVPVANWLRGPLHQWADQLLDTNRLSSQGILNPEPITRMWQQHQDCSRNWSQELWSVLMFQSWHSSYNLS